MSVQVTFDMKELNDELKRMGGQAAHQRDVNMQVAHILHAMVDDKFDAQGPGWKPLEQTTLKRRRGGSRVLQDTGHLANSMTPEAGDDFAAVFTNVDYATFHITGTKHMPKRDFLDIDMDKVFDQAVELILESITT